MLEVDNINLVKFVLCPLPENADESRVSIVYNAKDDIPHPDKVDSNNTPQQKKTQAYEKASLEPSI